MTKQVSKIYTMSICSLFAAVCCVLSTITIPIGTVPVSLGILAVLFTAVALGPVKGFVSVGVYLMLGLFLPIFSGGQTGFSAYPSHTGGYIWSYIIIALVVGKLTSINIGNKALEAALYSVICILGILICYTCGTVQFMLVTGYDLSSSLAVCVFPFVIFDIAKCVFAGITAPMVRSAVSAAKFN